MNPVPLSGLDDRRRFRSRPMAMHYPRRVSRIKKIRKQGFRARMRTKSGRKIINARRRMGRRVNVKS